MEATEPWALDLSRMESADVIDGLKEGVAQPESAEGGGDTLDGLARGDRETAEVDPTGDLGDGGMGISKEEINRGTGEIFSGITKVLSGAVGQDLTPDPDEKEEAGKKFGPLVQRRFPTVRKYTLETAALLWLVGYLNDKTDVAQLVK